MAERQDTFETVSAPPDQRHVGLWGELEAELAVRKQEGLFRSPETWTPLSARKIRSSTGQELIHFGSNDYLALSWHPEVLGQGFRTHRHPAGEELKTSFSQVSSVSEFASAVPPNADVTSNLGRCGAGASPLLAGHTEVHQSLCAALAKLKDAESVALFSSGYAANVGVVSALARPGDIVFSDQLNHASLIDGCRMSRASVFVYKHCDLEQLTRLVRLHRSVGKSKTRAFVLTDSLFSMDGDIADLDGITRLLHEYDLIGVVDEAHATGVYGASGGGLLEEFGCGGDRWVKVGTLSKAIGCMGGFVAGNRTLVEWVHNFARPYVYSTSMTLQNCRSAIASVGLLQGMSAERLRLRQQGRSLRQSLRELGYRVGGGDSPIVSIYLPSVSEVARASLKLRESGLYVPSIRPPTVPAESPMLRVSLNVSHDAGDIDRLVESLRG